MPELFIPQISTESYLSQDGVLGSKDTVVHKRGRVPTSHSNDNKRSK